MQVGILLYFEERTFEITAMKMDLKVMLDMQLYIRADDMISYRL
jgi:uncharacterized protein YqgQ